MISAVAVLARSRSETSTTPIHHFGLRMNIELSEDRLQVISSRVTADEEAPGNLRQSLAVGQKVEDLAFTLGEHGQQLRAESAFVHSGHAEVHAFPTREVQQPGTGSRAHDCSKCFLNGIAKRYRHTRFLQEPAYLAFIDRSGCGFDRGIPGKNDPARIGKLAGYDGEKLTAAHAGHALVGHDDIDLLLPQHLKPLGSRVGFQHRPDGTAQQTSESMRNPLLVIDEQKRRGPKADWLGPAGIADHTLYSAEDTR